MGKHEGMMLRQALEYPGDERHSGSNGKKYPLSRCSVGMVVTVLRVTSAGATAAVGFFVVMFIVMIATAMVVATTFLLVMFTVKRIVFVLMIATAMVVAATFLLVMFTVKRIVFVLMIATTMVVAATFLLVRGRCSGIFGVMRVTMLIHNSESCDDLMLQR